MSQEQQTFIATYIKPSRRACNYVYNRVGNKLPYRRAALGVMKMLHECQHQDWKGVASILKSMYSNLAITHLVIIHKYIIDSVPGNLVAPSARSETPGVLKAMARLAQLGPEHTFVRLLYDPSDTPELQSSQMSLITALARHLSMRDNPSYQYYEGGQGAEFKVSLDKLKREHANLFPIVTRVGNYLLNHEYDDEEALAVKASLQQDAP